MSGCERSTADNGAGGVASGDGGNDTMEGCRGCIGDNISFSGQTSGTGGNDTIIGTPKGDIAVVGDNSGTGGGGNDDISTLSGRDIIDGGPGQGSLRRRHRHGQREELRDADRHPLADSPR